MVKKTKLIKITSGILTGVLATTTLNLINDSEFAKANNESDTVSNFSNSERATAEDKVRLSSVAVSLSKIVDYELATEELKIEYNSVRKTALSLIRSEETTVAQINEKISEVQEVKNRLLASIQLAKSPKLEKSVIDNIVLSQNSNPVMDNLTFEIVEKTNPNVVLKEITSEYGMLSNIELDKSKEYTIRLKENEKYNANPINFKFGVVDGIELPIILETEEQFYQIDINLKEVKPKITNLTKEKILQNNENTTEALAMGTNLTNNVNILVKEVTETGEVDSTDVSLKEVENSSLGKILKFNVANNETTKEKIYKVYVGYGEITKDNKFVTIKKSGKMIVQNSEITFIRDTTLSLDSETQEKSIRIFGTNLNDNLNIVVKEVTETGEVDSSNVTISNISGTEKRKDVTFNVTNNTTLEKTYKVYVGYGDFDETKYKLVTIKKAGNSTLLEDSKITEFSSLSNGRKISATNALVDVTLKGTALNKDKITLEILKEGVLVNDVVAELNSNSATSESLTYTLRFPSNEEANEKLYKVRVKLNGQEIINLEDLSFTMKAKVDSSVTLGDINPISATYSKDKKILVLTFSENISKVNSLVDKIFILTGVRDSAINSEYKPLKNSDLVVANDNKINILLNDSLPDYASYYKIKLLERAIKNSNNIQNNESITILTEYSKEETSKITDYKILNPILKNIGGVVEVEILGENLRPSENGTRIRVVDIDTLAEDKELTNSLTYKVEEGKVIASVNFPKNTTNKTKSYSLSFYSDFQTEFVKERIYGKPIVSVLPANKENNSITVSNVMIGSYLTNASGHSGENLDRKHTTVSKNDVSKKTEIKVYGTNLSEDLTKIRIFDDNGVEWPIFSAGSNVSGTAINMSLPNTKGRGTGIVGNGNYQLLEVILPNNLSEIATFTYYISVDGSGNLEMSEVVKATVEPSAASSARENLDKRTITVKYVDEKGNKIKENKELLGYSWFEYNLNPDIIENYNYKNSDNQLTGVFGNVDKEITLTYENKVKNEIIVPEEYIEFYTNLFNSYSKFDKKYRNLTQDANTKYSVDNKPIKEGHIFTKEDFLMLEEVNITTSNVTDKMLEPLKYATNLKVFNVSHRESSLKRDVTNFDFLKNASKLTTFYYINQNQDNKTVAKTNIDLSALANLNNLEDLRINNTNLSNIEPLSKLNLKTLVITESELNSIDVLSNMTNLERLELTNNKIYTLGDISKLSNLVTLYLYGNPVSDITSISSLSNLEALHLKNTNITSIEALKNLNNLHRLRLDNIPTLTNYMNILKTMNALNTFAVDEISLDDIKWLKEFLIREEVDATYGEDKERVVTFGKLKINLDVRKEDVINGKITIDNPLTDWDGTFVKECDCNEKTNDKLEFTDDGKIIITLDNENAKNVEELYDILMTNYETGYGDYARPAEISGKVLLSINIVDNNTSKDTDDTSTDNDKKVILENNIKDIKIIASFAKNSEIDNNYQININSVLDNYIIKLASEKIDKNYNINLYNIYLTKNNEIINNNTIREVILEISKNLIDAKVYYYNEITKELVEINSSLENNNLIFNTDYFGKFVIATKLKEDNKNNFVEVDNKDKEKNKFDTKIALDKKEKINKKVLSKTGEEHKNNTIISSTIILLGVLLLRKLIK